MLLFAAIVGAAASSAVAVDIQVVHWNDLRGRNTPASGTSRELCLDGPYADESCYGGHARIATVCQQAKDQNVRTLCLDAGGELTGTAWDSLFQGAQTADVLPLVPTDALVVSERDLSYGVAALSSFVNALSPRVPVLGACNMDVSGEPALRKLKRWTVVNLAGTKVGLLGYAAVPPTAAVSASVAFVDPVEAMPGCLADFKASPEGADVAIVGFLSSAGLATDAEVADVVDGVDFIVSGGAMSDSFPEGKGHCLSLDASGACTERDTSPMVYPILVNEVPLLQQGPTGKYVGVSRMTFNGRGDLNEIASASVPLGVHFVDGERREVAEDKDVAAALASRFAEVADYERVVVGSLPVPLAAPATGSRETALGNFVCDATIDAVLRAGYQESTTTPLVCLLPAASFFAGLPAGEVTNAAIGAAVATGEPIEVIEVTGHVLRAALRQGAISAGAAFPSVGGGLSAAFSSRAGALAIAEIDCEEIDNEMTFHVATTRSVAAGAANYGMFVAAPRVLQFGATLDDAVAGFIGKFDAAGEQVPFVLTQTEGRVIDVESDAAPLCSTVRDRAAQFTVSALEQRRLSEAPRSFDGMPPMGVAGERGEFGGYGDDDRDMGPIDDRDMGPIDDRDMAPTGTRGMDAIAPADGPEEYDEPDVERSLPPMIDEAEPTMAPTGTRGIDSTEPVAPRSAPSPRAMPPMEPRGGYGGEGCDGECIPTFGKCAGSGIEGSMACCDAAYNGSPVRCVKKNDYYSQCRPESRALPRDWDGCEHDCSLGMADMCLM